VWSQPAWVIVVCFAFFFSLPFILAFIDGTLATRLENGDWRIFFLEPTLVLYILAVTPLVAKFEHEVDEAFYSISQLDRAEFERSVANAAHISRRAEVIAILIGVAIDLLLWGPQLLLIGSSVLRLYSTLASIVLFGMMGGVILGSLSSNRRMAVLHRQPINVNIFDIRPFEPIGRRSLYICLVFIGGTVISLLFVFSPESFFNFSNLVIYGTLITVIILLFFVNMWRTHLVLAQAKRDALGTAQGHIEQVYRALNAATEQHTEMPLLVAQLTAWITLEQRLRATRTWPYNTEMLRTLFISALVPLLLALVRLAFTWLTQNVFHF
jgi:hypothetical protein